MRQILLLISKPSPTLRIKISAISYHSYIFQTFFKRNSKMTVSGEQTQLWGWIYMRGRSKETSTETYFEADVLFALMILPVHLQTHGLLYGPHEKIITSLEGRGYWWSPGEKHTKIIKQLGIGSEDCCLGWDWRLSNICESTPGWSGIPSLGSYCHDQNWTHSKYNSQQLHCIFLLTHEGFSGQRFWLSTPLTIIDIQHPDIDWSSIFNEFCSKFSSRYLLHHRPSESG